MESSPKGAHPASTLRYLDVCAGISAASVAWKPLGWTPAAYSEISPFPRAVLAHRQPGVPIHGDFTTIGADDYGPIDLLVGGTPCQSFSTAGKRKGLDDPRGDLALSYLALAKRKRARWLVWENVPGVLSSNGGRDFGAFLRSLVECGYGFAYRILDAQYFGVPQRRRRVFLVGHSSGGWAGPLAVLFEREGLRRDPPPRREKGKNCAGTLGGSSQSGGFRTTDLDNTGAFIPFRGQFEGGGRLRIETHAAHDVVGAMVHQAHGGVDSQSAASGYVQPMSVVGGEAGLISFSSKDFGADAVQGITPTLRAMGGEQMNGGGQLAVAFTASARSHSYAWEKPVAPTLVAQAPSCTSHTQQGVRIGQRVRRLTEVECERLQGFPDGYTAIPWKGEAAEKCPAGHRYKALGNSMAVPVMRWVGERIAKVDAIMGVGDAV